MTELKQATTTNESKDDTTESLFAEVDNMLADPQAPAPTHAFLQRYWAAFDKEVREAKDKEPAILIETPWDTWKRTDEFPQQLYDEIVWEHQIDNKKAGIELEVAIRQTRFHRMQSQQRTFDWGLDPPLTAAFVSFWTKAGAVSVRAYETEIENWWVELVVS